MTALAAQTEEELAALAVAMGALEYGGPLSQAEADLVVGLPNGDGSRAIEVKTAIRAGGDPLGDAFAVIRSPEVRRKDGIFWTPPEIVGPMLDWALGSGATRVVDPGSGSGRFSAEAVRRNPDIAVVALDLEPIGALMTRAAMAALDAKFSRVICADYLTADIPDHDGKTAWVGNPPYVRHHDLTPETKAWAGAAAKKLGIKVSGLAGLHALFFLATALHAKSGDVGCFVTSSEWLDVGYGSVVRDLMMDGLGGTALDLVDPKAVPFADAMTTALIACFEVGSEPAGIIARMVSQPADLAKLAEGKVVPLADLAAQHHWSPFFRANGHAVAAANTIGSLFKVSRGFATGANGYFLMTKEEAERRGLSRWAKPAITQASEIISSGGTVRDTPERRVVIDIPKDIDRAAEPAADAWLKEGEAAQIDQGYLCSHRKPWWRIGLLPAAPIVASYMARQAPVFALNPDGLVLLNIGHGLYPRKPMKPAEVKATARKLTASRLGFAGSGRTYHGGLEKFEPREMEALTIG